MVFVKWENNMNRKKNDDVKNKLLKQEMNKFLEFINFLYFFLLPLSRDKNFKKIVLALPKISFLMPFHM